MKRGIAEVGLEEAGRKREHRVAEPYSAWRAPSPLATRSFVSEELVRVRADAVSLCKPAP